MPRTRTRLLVFGMMALIAAAAGCAPSATGPTGAPVGPSATPTSSSIAASVGLAHLAVNRIGFDYPAAWTQHTMPPGSVPVFGGLTFVGTAPSGGGCRPTGANSNTCGPDFALTPGKVSVAVYWLDGPMTIDPFAPISERGPNDRLVTVDNVPAAMTDIHASRYVPGAREITLELVGPSFTAPPIFVLAEFEGPGEDVLTAQVAALLASVRYEPALQPTVAMGPAAAAAAAMAAVRKLTSDFAATGGLPCFHEPGGPVRSAMLTSVPGGPELTKALPVTCSTTIEGTGIEVWRFAVNISWAASADRKAGAADLLTWVSPDGDALPFGQAGDPIPYQV